MSNSVWVFHGENAQLSSGIFSSLDTAELFIEKYTLSGILSKYPLDMGIYDWAIENDFFRPKRDEQKSPSFIQEFTTAGQEHYHYENGKRD